MYWISAFLFICLSVYLFICLFVDLVICISGRHTLSTINYPLSIIHYTLFMFAHLGLGCLMSFLGSLPVGMISLLVVETTINKSTQEGMQVGLGASIIESIQAFIAISFIALFIAYPSLETIISVLSIPILGVLGWQHLRSDGKIKRKTAKSSRSSFWRGIVISSLNMLAIPYWILWGGVFMKQGWLLDGYAQLVSFSVGVGLGTFLAMLVYILLGVFLSERLQQYNKWINRFIGLLFWGLALIQMYFIFMY